MNEYQNLKLDILTRKLFLDGRLVFLRNQEFNLLNYFIDNPGRVLSRTEILEDVWDRNILCPTNTLDVHVSNLRKIFRKYSNAEPIKTVHCIGYIFDL